MNRIAKFLRDYALARFLIPAGIILMIAGIIFYGVTDSRKGYPVTDGVVTRSELFEEEYYDGEDHHDATYEIYVRYTVDGKEYESEYGIFPEMKEGTEVKLNYNPEDPTDIGQPNSIALPIGLIAGGVAAIAIGIISVVVTFKKNRALKKQEEAWQNGN